MIAVVASVLWFFVGVFALLSLFGYTLYLMKFKYKIQITQNIPSPPSWPIVGHGYHFFCPPHQIYQKFVEFVATYGYIVKIWLGPELNMVLADPKDIECVVSNVRFNDKAQHYSNLKPWLQEGLLVSGGKKWHQRRKALTPAFHFSILNQFIEVFEKQSHTFVTNLDMEYHRQTEQGFDLYNWVELCTLDVICETAMGVSVNAQTNIDSDFVTAIKSITDIMFTRMFNVLYRYDFIYELTPLAREAKKALAIIHGFSESVIVKRRAELLKCLERCKNDTVYNDTDSNKKMTFLDILLQTKIDGIPLRNVDIREEVDTFIFEGHDTTASALLFCFYNLAINPECQGKCVKELVEVLGRNTAIPVTYENLNKLNYLELCIKESLRLFPPVPIYGRKVAEECELNGKIIPAGTNLGLSPLLMGRRADLFPDPLSFKPERFKFDENAAKVNPYAYVPFAAGPRNCIGQKFAMLEMKMILANSLRHYEFNWLGNREEELLLNVALILRPKDPLMFKIKPRKLFN